MDAKFYDKGWEQRWDDMKLHGPYSRHVRAWIHRMISGLEFQSVLDAGCGQGELLKEISTLYPRIQHIAGIDFSATSVNIAHQKIGQGRFEVVDLQTQRLDETFDLTLCVDVIEHIPDDVAALVNLRKMTGKYALVSSIQGKSLPKWEEDVLGHVRNYKRGELAEKMKKAGFSIHRVIEWGFPFYSPMFRWTLTRFKGQGTDGEYGFRRKLIATTLYAIYFLNSSRRGDLIQILARPNSDT